MSAEFLDALPLSLRTRVDQVAARVADALVRYPRAVLATSFGAEDMVLLDLLDAVGAEVEVFTLDTGRLPEETHALMDEVRQRYRLRVRTFFPDAAQVERMVAEQGANGFRVSVDARKRCCQVRKLEPLARALQGKSMWITGLRREQAVTRAGLDVLARDEGNGLMKLAPLADWTAADVDAYVRARGVPVNALHARGYPSIGCAPCTRAVTPGEDARAGRWWWEQPESKECGLHLGPDGRLGRAKTIAVALAP